MPRDCFFRNSPREGFPLTAVVFPCSQADSRPSRWHADSPSSWSDSAGPPNGHFPKPGPLCDPGSTTGGPSPRQTGARAPVPTGRFEGGLPHAGPFLPAESGKCAATASGSDCTISQESSLRRWKTVAEVGGAITMRTGTSKWVPYRQSARRLSEGTVALTRLSMGRQWAADERGDDHDGQSSVAASAWAPCGRGRNDCRAVGCVGRTIGEEKVRSRK